MSFSHAIWLFPVAYALHVAEEYPRFVRWAQQHASPAYTLREYRRVHAFGGLSSLAIATFLFFFPESVFVILAFEFAIAPGLLCNALFHSGASIVTRSYCPGVVSALVVYIPVFVTISVAAIRRGLITTDGLAGTALIALAFHVWEVGHNVFKRW
jgi:hypothetical protein